MDSQDEAVGHYGSQVSRHLQASRVTPMSSKLPVAFINTALDSTGSIMLWPVIVHVPSALTHTLGAGCPPPNLLPLVHLLFTEPFMVEFSGISVSKTYPPNLLMSQKNESESKAIIYTSVHK